MTHAAQISLTLTNTEPLPLDFFFDYPCITELNMSSIPLCELPLSISQCYLLQKIDISETLMRKPPPILFSLPNIRENPASIIFGHNSECTHELSNFILDDMKEGRFSQFLFQNPDHSYQNISLSPETSCIDFIRLSFPELSSIYEDLHLIRLIQSRNIELPIIIDDTPFSLYQYPESVFSLRFCRVPDLNEIPTDSTVFKYLLIDYVKYHLKCHNLESQLQNYISLDTSSLYSQCLSQQLLSNPTFHFDAKSSHGIISMEISCGRHFVDIHTKDNSDIYSTFPISTMSLELREELILAFGEQGFALTTDSLIHVMPIFLFTVAAFTRTEIPTDDFFHNLTSLAAAECGSVLNNRGKKHAHATAPIVISRLKYTPPKPTSVLAK